MKQNIKENFHFLRSSQIKTLKPINIPHDYYIQFLSLSSSSTSFSLPHALIYLSQPQQLYLSFVSHNCRCSRGKKVLGQVLRESNHKKNKNIRSLYDGSIQNSTFHNRKPHHGPTGRQIKVFLMRFQDMHINMRYGDICVNI